MSQSHRVIVTGIDTAGKSAVVEDAQATLCVMVGGK
jgi:adenylate kinase